MGSGGLEGSCLSSLGAGYLLEPAEAAVHLQCLGHCLGPCHADAVSPQAAKQDRLSGGPTSSTGQPRASRGTRYGKQVVLSPAWGSRTPQGVASQSWVLTALLSTYSRTCKLLLTIKASARAWAPAALMEATWRLQENRVLQCVSRGGCCVLIRRANQTSCSGRALPQPVCSLEICQRGVDLQCSSQGGHSLIPNGVLLQAETSKYCVCPEQMGAGKWAAKRIKNGVWCVSVLGGPHTSSTPNQGPGMGTGWGTWRRQRAKLTPGWCP